MKVFWFVAALLIVSFPIKPVIASDEVMAKKEKKLLVKLPLSKKRKDATKNVKKSEGVLSDEKALLEVLRKELRDEQKKKELLERRVAVLSQALVNKEKSLEASKRQLAEVKEKYDDEIRKKRSFISSILSQVEEFKSKLDEEEDAQ